MTGPVEQYNKKLNESMKAGNTYKEWTEYRKAITDTAAANIKHKGSTVLFGAGNLFDIDIKTIIDLSGSILLADIDTDNVNGSLLEQNIFSKKITTVKVDFGSMDNQNILNKINGMLLEKNYGGCREFLDTYPLETGDFGLNKKFDSILISAVYTQMFVPQFLDKLKTIDIPDKEQKSLIESALAFSGRLISITNESIFSIADKNADLCAWSDILEYSNDDIALSDIKSHINNKAWMDEFYASYQNTYGHGLGSFGIYDIGLKLDSVSENWLLWPFDKYRVMLVKIISGKIYHS